MALSSGNQLAKGAGLCEDEHTHSLRFNATRGYAGNRRGLAFQGSRIPGSGGGCHGQGAAIEKVLVKLGGGTSILNSCSVEKKLSVGIGGGGSQS